MARTLVGFIYAVSANNSPAAIFNSPAETAACAAKPNVRKVRRKLRRTRALLS